MRFVDIKNDVAFRKIFGNEKKTIVLISFLNAVLRLDGENAIVSVMLVDPNLFPRIAGEKASIIDVRATDQAGRHFVVEMQVADPKGFSKRVQYYTSREYSSQIDTGEKYFELQPTYFIGILNFDLGKNPNYFTNHLILDNETYENVLNDIKFSFIQLKKFNKNEFELETLIDKWTYFIKNASDLDVVPQFANTDEGLKEAFIEADMHLWSKEQWKQYDDSKMREQDERGVLQKATEVAKLEGRNEGECLPILKALRKNKTPEQIAEFNDVKIDLVLKLKTLLDTYGDTTEEHLNEI